MRHPIAVSTALLTLLATAPLTAQNYTGTYLLQASGGGTVTLTLRQDGAGKATGTMSGNGVTFQLAGQLQGPELVGKATGGGNSAWFEASLDGAELHLVVADVGANGQPDLAQAREIVFTRSGTAQAAPAPRDAPAPPPRGAPTPPAPRAPLAAPRAPAATPEPPGNDQDAQLRAFLLSSAWCSFSYNKVSGSTNTSRNVFLANGILMIGTNREGGTVNQNGGGAGANGSYYSQSQGGQQARWQVQGGQLYVDLGQGMQAVPMQITRNSSGYPIITASGTEYSQCQ
jgi:hypothetical protein